eukprot:5185335-Prymnesium_polylepis.1
MQGRAGRTLVAHAARFCRLGGYVYASILVREQMDCAEPIWRTCVPYVLAANGYVAMYETVFGTNRRRAYGNRVPDLRGPLSSGAPPRASQRHLLKCKPTARCHES